MSALTFRDTCALAVCASTLRIGMHLEGRTMDADIGAWGLPVSLLVGLIFFALAALQWRIIAGKNRWGW